MISFVNIDEFIEKHNQQYTNYCEAIIHSNGNIAYAEPSHLLKLQLMWGVPKNELFDGGPIRDKLYEQMPQCASPVHWLAEILNCVVIWYNAAIFPPNYTAQQINSIQKLIENKCISASLSIDITMEYQICQDNISANEPEHIHQNKNQMIQEIVNTLKIQTPQ